MEYGNIYVNKIYQIYAVVKSFWERNHVFIKNTFHVSTNESNM